MRRSHRLLLLILAVLAGGMPAGSARAQDSVTVVAGPQYRAGALQRLLWGDNYRDLWTLPVRVPVLDPDTFAGGLTPLRAGGDFASNTLHLRGADGRRYVFRSVDKDVSKGLGPEFEGTLVEWVVQDQVSASHPAAPTLAAPLAAGAGVLHVPPRLVVMADRPSLAACRQRFAGVLGHIEERADENDVEEADEQEPEEESADAAADAADEPADPLRESCGAPEPAQVDGPNFAGADAVKGTENFLDDLEDSPTDQLDSRAYLAARLLDIFIGDWDRHEDQWRWAGFDRGDLRIWRPIPRDRDNAFVRHEGLLLALGRRIFVRMVRFDDEYPGLTGLTVQAQPLDRRLLSDLPRTAWDSVAVQLRARLTDAVIDDAVAALPPAYREGGRGEEMARTLRARREGLPRQAAAFYARLALNVDVHATDVDELAVVDRHPDGTLDVTITGAGDDTGRFVTYQRRFLPSETDDVRLYMQGGDDRVVVRGPGHGVGVRVIGGGGDDVLVDSSRATGVAFYDHRGDNRFVRGGGTRVSTRDWDQPTDTSSITGKRTYRDWGWSISPLSVAADWRRGAGPVLLVGPAMTKYGFRRQPYAWHAYGRVGWAPVETRFTVEAGLRLHPENARHAYEVRAYASELENVRFYGFGNATPTTGVSSRYDTWLRQVRVEPALVLPLARGGRLSVGPVFQWTEPEVEFGSPLDVEQPLGVEAYTQLGLRADAELDGRDAAAFPRAGWRVEAGGSGYPGVVEAAGPFGEAHATGAAYLSAGGGPVLALRAGGRRVWGDFPFFESAFLGGGATLRGHTGQRFAGDAMVFGGAEVRVPVVRANLGLRGTLGLIGLADAGRVWFDGRSAGDWHSALGAGVFFHAIGQSAHVTVAHGERMTINFGLGMPF